MMMSGVSYLSLASLRSSILLTNGSLWKSWSCKLCFRRRPSLNRLSTSWKALKSWLSGEMAATKSGRRLWSTAFRAPAVSISTLPSSNWSSRGAYMGSGSSTLHSASLSANYTPARLISSVCAWLFILRRWRADDIRWKAIWIRLCSNTVIRAKISERSRTSACRGSPSPQSSWVGHLIPSEDWPCQLDPLVGVAQIVVDVVIINSIGDLPLALSVAPQLLQFLLPQLP